MTLQEFLALLVLATVMSFTPGPNTTLSTALAANGGLKSALRFCLAVPAGWTVLMLACGLGLGAVVTTAPLLRGAVKAVGIGYMLYLAWRLCQVRVLAQTDGARLNVGFLQGVALQFVNIKAWMLALALTGGWVVSQGGQPAAPQREQDRAHARRGVVERADDAGRVHHHRVQPTVDDAPQLDLTRRLRTVVGRQLRPLGARGGLVHGPAGHGGQIEGVHGAAVHESGNAVLERRLGHNPYAVDVD